VLPGRSPASQGKAVLAVENQERVIHVLLVMAVEEAELLPAVGGFVGGVRVQDDDLAGDGRGFEIEAQQPVGEAAQVLGGHPVLKPGQRRLRGQVVGSLRGPARHDLVSRVLGQGGGVVVVLVTQGDGEQTLANQGKEIVPNLAGIPRVMQTGSRRLGDPVALVHLPEQQAAGVRGDPAPGKIGHDFLVKKAFKDKLVMADCFPRVSLRRSCLSSDYSMLADTLCLLKHFS